MATFNHDLATNSGYAIASCQLGEIRALRAVVTAPAGLAVTDEIRMFKLPAEHLLVDCVLAAGDLDSGAGLVLDVGVIDDDQDPADTSDPNCLIAGSTIGQGGGIERMNAVEGLALAPVNYDRFIAITVNTGAAGAQAADLDLTVFIRTKQNVETAQVL